MSKIYWSWRNISGSLRRIWQNIIRGWNDSDCWSLDYTIAKFVLPRLQLLKKNKMGCPCIDGINSDTDEGFKKLQEEWDKILDKMIFAFDCIVNHAYDNDLYEKTCTLQLSMKFIPCENNCSRMEWDGNKVELEVHDNQMKKFYELSQIRYKEIQDGLDLFAKYYMNLWD